MAEATERKRILRNSMGFTLIELLVVIVIIGLLAAIVGPKVIKKVEPSKQAAAKAQIELFGAALDQYALDTGDYPSTSDGLEALVRNPGKDNWDGPYLKKNKVPLDPWETPYRYTSPGANGDYDIISYGKDKQQGGDGDNADIVSWE